MTWIPSAIWLFVCGICVHAVMARVAPKINRILLFIFCGCVVGGGWIVDHLFRQAAPVDIQFLSDVLLFACLCELYIILMMFSLASVSASIAHRMLRKPMTASEIDVEYSSEEMLRSRIDRLIETGYFTESGDQLALADKARRSLRIFDAMRRFFGHGP